MILTPLFLDKIPCKRWLHAKNSNRHQRENEINSDWLARRRPLQIQTTPRNTLHVRKPDRPVSHDPSCAKNPAVTCRSLVSPNCLQIWGNLPSRYQRLCLRLWLRLYEGINFRNGKPHPHDPWFWTYTDLISEIHWPFPSTIRSKRPQTWISLEIPHRTLSPRRQNAQTQSQYSGSLLILSGLRHFNRKSKLLE